MEVPSEKKCPQNVHVMPPPSIFSTYSQKGGSFGRLILISGSIEKKKEKDMSTRCPIKK
jgi:hypothetical protein